MACFVIIFTYVHQLYALISFSLCLFLLVAITKEIHKVINTSHYLLIQRVLASKLHLESENMVSIIRCNS